MRLVWDETARIIDDLIELVWKSAPEVTIKDAKDFTLPVRQLSLYVKLTETQSAECADCSLGHWRRR